MIFGFVLTTSSLCYFPDNNGSREPVLSKSMEVLLLLHSFFDGCGLDLTGVLCLHFAFWFLLCMDFSRLGFGLDLVAWLRYCDAIDDGSTRSMTLAWMLCWILLALVLAWAWFLGFPMVMLTMKAPLGH